MEVLVIGAGSLGSLVGGLLARDHDVTLVGRLPHVDAIREHGLSIGGEVQTRVHPAATVDPVLVDDGPDLSADLAIVTVKSYDTADAARTLAACDVDAVWSLQNGLGNEETLADALDVPVLAGTATYGADQRTAGSVVCTGLGEVAIGPRPGTPTPEEDAALARRLGAELSEGAGDADAVGAGDADVADAGDADHRLAVVVDEEMPRRLWLKLAVNVAINPTTALARVENGALAEGDAAEGAKEAARETARVAAATGIDRSPEDAVAEFESVVEATASNRSSMYQDVEAGRQTEIDAIAGAVVERADEHDVAVPVTRTLAGLVREWERGSYLR